jgi:formylglycine-generating enzyme required for sulfatase activity
VADWLTVETTPAGAAVWLQRFAPPDTAGRLPDSVVVGTTPVRELRVARGDYRLVVRLPGYAPVERIASTEATRISGVLRPDPTRATFAFTLLRADSVPPGMVHVPGGRYELVSPDLPRGISTELADFFIDRTEVTNAAYREYVGRTGVPVPRGWSGGEPPPGQLRHPVTGVSWHEATAFCAWRGASLPTVFEWEKAARNGEITPVGTIMPWGHAGQGTALRANFSSSGPQPVDAHPFGVSPWGARDMAGNVKEWTANELGDGRAVTGGSWEDPSYQYANFGDYPAEGSNPAIGFRCSASPAARDQGTMPLRFDQRTPVYRPVSEAVFRGFLAFYRYDSPSPLGERTIARHETPDWVREKVVYQGIGGDSLIAYLYLPRSARPPFQTLVYVGAGNVFQGDSVWHDAEWLMGEVIRSGRAVLAPVLEGMTERDFAPGLGLPDPPSVEFRQLMIRHSTELRIGLDYLETRPEIDRTQLVYSGASFSAGSRLPLAGTDERWRGLVLIAAGIDERIQPTLPEASNINFAPRLKPPKLMVNGRQDEEHNWFTRALPLWNLLREPKELVLVEGAGHTPPQSALVPAIVGWLDRTIGRPEALRP